MVQVLTISNKEKKAEGEKLKEKACESTSNQKSRGRKIKFSKQFITSIQSKHRPNFQMGDNMFNHKQ